MLYSNDISNIGVVSLRRGSMIEKLTCYIQDNKLCLLNSKNEKCGAAWYISSGKHLLILKFEEDGVKEIYQSDYSEYYGGNSDLYIINRDNDVLCEKVCGYKYIDNDTVIAFTSKNELYSCEQGRLSKIEYDYNACGYVIKKGVRLNLHVWKQFNDTYLFIIDNAVAVYYKGEFVKIKGDAYSWRHDDSRQNIIAISRDGLSFYGESLESVLVDYQSDKISFSNMKFCTNDYIVFCNSNGLLVIDNRGYICWDSDVSFSPQGITGNILWEFSQSAYKRTYVYEGYVRFYDVFGNKILSDRWVGSGEKGQNKHLYNNSDYARFELERKKHTTNKAGAPAFGVICIPTQTVILPAVFDDITIAECCCFNPLSSIYHEYNEKKAFFVVRIGNSVNLLYGCFDDKSALFPIGTYDKIIALQYIDRWCERWYEKNIYGIDVDRCDVHEDKKFSGWFALYKGDTLGLAYQSEIVFQDAWIMDYKHVNNCSLYLSVQVGDRWGLLSPIGWIINPSYDSITRIASGASEEYNGSAAFFTRKNIFAADGDIYSVEVVEDESEGKGKIMSKCEFEKKDRYEYLRMSRQAFGADFYYVDIISNKEVKINICNSAVSDIIETGRMGTDRNSLS